MRRRKKTCTPPPQTRSSETWLNELRARCALAGVRYLKQGVNCQKTIFQLTKAELEGLAEAITAEWIVAVSEKRAKDASSPTGATELPDAYPILLGG